MLRNNIRSLCRETKKTVNIAKNDYQLNSEEFSQKFREQNMLHAQNMHVIKDQYKKMSNLYKTKKEFLANRDEIDGSRLNMVTTKRQLDLEGFQSDLGNLKKRMVFYQNYIGKLKKLVDREEEHTDNDKQKDLFGNMENDVIYENAEEEE